jgi:hypothetical protein
MRLRVSRSKAFGDGGDKGDRVEAYRMKYLGEADSEKESQGESGQAFVSILSDAGKRAIAA